MRRVAIVVEGATEQAFVAQVVADHLRPLGLEATPVLVRRRGGSVNVPRLAATMSGVYWSFHAVTSFVDFYGFERKGDASVDDLEVAIGAEVRSRVRTEWDERRVLPYVQMHEFEALLFTDPEAFSAIGAAKEAMDDIRAIAAGFATPEEINDRPTKAPSKRIAAALVTYDKVVEGVTVAKEIGLGDIRLSCPRFNVWLTRLEALPRQLRGT